MFWVAGSCLTSFHTFPYLMISMLSGFPGSKLCCGPKKCVSESDAKLSTSLAAHVK